MIQNLQKPPDDGLPPTSSHFTSLLGHMRPIQKFIKILSELFELSLLILLAISETFRDRTDVIKQRHGVSYRLSNDPKTSDLP